MLPKSRGNPSDEPSRLTPGAGEPRSPSSIEIANKRRRLFEGAHALDTFGTSPQLAHQTISILKVGVATELALDPIGIDAHFRRAPQDALRNQREEVDNVRRVHCSCDATFHREKPIPYSNYMTPSFSIFL